MKCPCKKVNAMRTKIHELEIEKMSLIASLNNTRESLLRKQKRFDYESSLQEALSELRQIEKEVFIFMHTVKEGKLEFDTLKERLKYKINSDDFRQLYNCIFDERKYIRDKSLAIIYSLFGIHQDTISRFLFLYKRTIRKKIANFYKHGIGKYLKSRRKEIRVFDNPEIQRAVFSVLHNPPILHGINRTSWTGKLIQKVVNKQGYKVVFCFIKY